MMRSRSGHLARFVLILLVALAALIAAWPSLAPHYTSAIATIARPVFRLVEHPNVTVLDVQGDALHVYEIIGEGRITPVVEFEPFVFFAIVPLVALFLATPGLGIRRRLARTAIGIAALFCLHVAYLVASVELIYAVAAGRTLDAMQIGVRVLWEASPILIWVSLTAGAWMRLLRSVRSECKEKPHAPSTEPAGAEG